MASIKQYIVNTGLAIYALITCICIYLTTVVGYPLKLVSPRLATAWMSVGQKMFAVFLIGLTGWRIPAKITVYSDEELAGKFKLDSHGRLHSDLDKRAVVIANHTLYSDWVYLWWLAYTSDLAGSLTIALKASLKKVPVFGWGMQHFQFLFLKRKWQDDEATIAKTMHRLATDKTLPAWMVIFPEGTTVSRNGVRRTQEYSQKSGLAVPRNLLLPRIRGLQAVLQGLHNGLPYLYNFTMYYDGVPAGQYGEDYFTLKSMFGGGRYPKHIQIHLQRIDVRDIPYNDEAAFTEWMLQLWKEKDDLVDKMRHHELTNGLETRMELDSPLELLGPYNLPVGVYCGQSLLRKLFS